MSFITEGKTNWKYVVIVTILFFLVGGEILVYTKETGEKIDFVSQPLEIKKPVKVIKNETADWKIYESNKFGFLIKYPSDWQISDRTGFKGAQVIFDSPISPIFNSGVSIAQLPAYDDIRGRKITFEEVVSDYKIKLSEEFKDVKEEYITLDNIPAVNLSFIKDGKYLDNILTLSTNDVFVITCYSDNLEKNACKSTFNLMLSSFKFIEKPKQGFLGIFYKNVSIFSEDEKEKIGLPKELNYGAIIMSQDLIKDLNWKTSMSGDAVDGIVAGSPADVAGLKARDIIIEVNGEKAINLEKITEKLIPGEKIQVKILREGKKHYIEMILTEKPDNLIH